jgi:hypothetical protein
MSWDSPGWKTAAAEYHAEQHLREQPAPRLRSNGHDPRAHVSPPIVAEATPPAPLDWLDMSSWDSDPIPERNQAGLFSGEGGAGKSIIELGRCQKSDRLSTSAL